MTTKRFLILSFLILFSAPTSKGACPNLSGHYQRESGSGDGMMDWTIKQKACDQVDIVDRNEYGGEVSITTTTYFTDGKSHGAHAEAARWKPNQRLEINDGTQPYELGFDKQGNLHEYRPGGTYPQCPCDDVWQKVPPAAK